MKEGGRWGRVFCLAGAARRGETRSRSRAQFRICRIVFLFCFVLFRPVSFVGPWVGALFFFFGSEADQQREGGGTGHFENRKPKKDMAGRYCSCAYRSLAGYMYVERQASKQVNKKCSVWRAFTLPMPIAYARLCTTQSTLLHSSSHLHCNTLDYTTLLEYMILHHAEQSGMAGWMELLSSLSRSVSIVSEVRPVHHVLLFLFSPFNCFVLFCLSVKDVS